jgi:hypothetical protein
VLRIAALATWDGNDHHGVWIRTLDSAEFKIFDALEFEKSAEIQQQIVAGILALEHAGGSGIIHVENGTVTVQPASSLKTKSSDTTHAVERQP